MPNPRAEAHAHHWLLFPRSGDIVQSDIRAWMNGPATRVVFGFAAAVLLRYCEHKQKSRAIKTSALSTLELLLLVCFKVIELLLLVKSWGGAKPTRGVYCCCWASQDLSGALRYILY
jgi:hypothetical protein